MGLSGTTIRIQFGLNVRLRRTQQGFSQEVLGNAAGLDRTYISGIERGIRNPSLEIIGRLASALGCSPAELLDLALLERDEPGH